MNIHNTIKLLIHIKLQLVVSTIFNLIICNNAELSYTTTKVVFHSKKTEMDQTVGKTMGDINSLEPQSPEFKCIVEHQYF